MQIALTQETRKDLFRGISNKGLVDYVNSVLERTKTKNPFTDSLEVYKYSYHGILTWATGVYQPFTCNGREIDPDQTVKNFLKVGSAIYGLAMQGVKDAAFASLEANRLCSLRQANGDEWVELLRSLLENEIVMAEDLAFWVNHLSQGAIVGPIVRSKVEKYGITDIKELPRDVRKIGANVLTLYDLLTS